MASYMKKSFSPGFVFSKIPRRCAVKQRSNLWCLQVTAHVPKYLLHKHPWEPALHLLAAVAVRTNCHVLGQSQRAIKRDSGGVTDVTRARRDEAVRGLIFWHGDLLRSGEIRFTMWPLRCAEANSAGSLETAIDIFVLPVTPAKDSCCLFIYLL